MVHACSSACGEHSGSGGGSPVRKTSSLRLVCSTLNENRCGARIDDVDARLLNAIEYECIYSGAVHKVIMRGNVATS